jgi:serpin B
MESTSLACRRPRARRVGASLAATAVTAALLAGCGSRPGPAASAPEKGTAAAEPAASPKPYAAADLRFGLDLLHVLCTQQPDQNIVLSPASLASSLGLAYLGAGGATARAIAAVLHLPAASRPALLAGLQARERAIASLSGGRVTVTEANQVWSDPGLIPRRSYLNAVATGYGAGLRRAPLQTDPVQSAGLINAAIAAQTRGHIRNLVTPQLLTGAGWVLTDAMFLQAAWASPFQGSQVQTNAFGTAAGQSVAARYLNGGPFAATTAAGWTAVSLPYRGGRLAMEALLPPAGLSAGACPVLTAAQAGALAAALRRPGAQASADVALPEVSLRTQASLRGPLSQLGLGPAFSGAADFAGLSPQAASLGAVVQAATLRVDTQGTVGSAASAVTVLPLALRATRPSIRFSRPYLLLLTDTSTGEPLFLARVANPALP